MGMKFQLSKRNKFKRFSAQHCIYSKQHCIVHVHFCYISCKCSYHNTMKLLNYSLFKFPMAIFFLQGNLHSKIFISLMNSIATLNPCLQKNRDEKWEFISPIICQLVLFFHFLSFYLLLMSLTENKRLFIT